MKCFKLTKNQNRQIRALSNEFYNVELNLLDFSSYCVAYGYIIRKDTGEYLSSFFRERLKGSGEAFSTVILSLNEKIITLPCPKDWGKPDEVRLLINQQILFEQQWRELILKENLKLSEKNMVEDDLFNFARNASSILHHHTIDMCKKLNDISESNLIRLVGIEDKPIYRLPNEEEGAREDAKFNLYDYILSPTQKVIEAHSMFMQYKSSGHI